MTVLVEPGAKDSSGERRLRFSLVEPMLCLLLIHKDTYSLSIFLESQDRSVVNNLFTSDYLAYPEKQINVRMKGGDILATPFFL